MSVPVGTSILTGAFSMRSSTSLRRWRRTARDCSPRERAKGAPKASDSVAVSTNVVKAGRSRRCASSCRASERVARPKPHERMASDSCEERRVSYFSQ